ncbi:MAG TPA: histone deacetylase [Acidimicrobiales bacterium]|jgi:acetoin utilization deacetylase AcuC-like enzyme|nr:histone deacetylase [Acidimicrobiales bacterium]
MAPVLVLSSGPTGARHATGTGHPERAERLAAVERGIERAALAVEVTRIDGRPATTEELARVHDAGYLERISAFIAAGGGAVDADTRVSSGSWDAALLAAGSGLVAVDALRAGSGRSAFVAVRPPGHHATGDTAMGFCLLNNVAVAAAALAEAGERVLIIDWDVHHGNGTQDIFWDDPRVLYVSTHGWPLYPGTGRPEETGGTAAPAGTVNVPLPSGATGDVGRAAFEEIVAPVVDRFGPTWVLVSAGFDAHRKDPLAALEWSSGDFADLTELVLSWAPPGRVIAFLEGGYDLGALEDSTAATVAALGGTHDSAEPPTSGGPGRDLLAGIARRRAEAVDRT